MGSATAPRSSYAIFLRGVNVGGINLKMADLASELRALPVSEVKTLLASGNVVLASGLGPAELKSAVETRLREAFGYEAWVIVLEATALDAVIDACPYPAGDKTTHSYVTLSSDPTMLDELWALGEDDGAEQLRLAPGAMAWLCPAGSTLNSALGKAGGKARYKASTTTRNLRTLLKVQAALRALPAS